MLSQPAQSKVLQDQGFC
ncbi:hypothetical protein BsWGS_28479 [Bradybaena similaris]